ncbi:hypothetical protein GIB67_005749, partial [Kingdonia uniflora]
MTCGMVCVEFTNPVVVGIGFPKRRSLDGFRIPYSGKGEYLKHATMLVCIISEKKKPG